MCRKCREQHAEALEAAMEHCDAEGIPQDSLYRGLVNIQLACSANPMLEMLMQEMHPTPQTLMN